jgi:hypothetical protein
MDGYVTASRSAGLATRLRWNAKVKHGMHFPEKQARGHNKKYQEDDEKSQEQPPSISPLRGDRMLTLVHDLRPLRAI